MMDPLFPEMDPDARRESIERREDALRRVRANAPTTWTGWAEFAARYVATHRREFTTDPIWSVLHAWGIPDPPNKKAMGTITRQIVAWGWCRKTGRVRTSVQKSNNGRPVAIYESRLFKEGAA